MFSLVAQVWAHAPACSQKAPVLSESPRALRKPPWFRKAPDNIAARSSCRSISSGRVGKPQDQPRTRHPRGAPSTHQPSRPAASRWQRRPCSRLVQVYPSCPGPPCHNFRGPVRCPVHDASRLQALPFAPTFVDVQRNDCFELQPEEIGTLGGLSCSSARTLGSRTRRPARSQRPWRKWPQSFAKLWIWGGKRCSHSAIPLNCFSLLLPRCLLSCFALLLRLLCTRRPRRIALQVPPVVAQRQLQEPTAGICGNCKGTKQLPLSV